MSEQLENEDNVDKAITLEKSVLHLTKEYAQEISNDDLSKKEKIIHYATIAIGAGIGVFSIIGAGITKKQYIPMIGSVLGGSILGSAAGDMSAIKMVKSSMNYLVKSHESALAVLQEFKKLGFTSCKEARSKYKVKVDKNGIVKLTEKKR